LQIRYSPVRIRPRPFHLFPSKSRENGPPAGGSFRRFITGSYRQKPAFPRETRHCRYARALCASLKAAIRKSRELVLAKVCREGWHPPLFAVVPDVPYDGEATYRELAKHAPLMRELFPTVPLALSVQDGMSPKVGAFVAKEAGCQFLFVAGSDEWKDRTAHDWAWEGERRGLRTHLARANETFRITLAKQAGCFSSDGTGIWRGDKSQKGRVLLALKQELMFAGLTPAPNARPAPLSPGGRWSR
jgi:hypothetical protein